MGPQQSRLDIDSSLMRKIAGLVAPETCWEAVAQQACTPAVTFPDENSESESDSDDRFKGKAWHPFPALVATAVSLPFLCKGGSSVPNRPGVGRQQAGRLPGHHSRKL